MRQAVQLEMPDGHLLWATVDEQGPTDSGLRDDLVDKLQGFQESVRAVAMNTRRAVAAARPDEVSIEFGMELAAGKDGLVAAIVGAGGTAAFNVTLTWTSREGAAGAPQPQTEADA
ncbi:CU044_2847 family protein [Streptomyces sp. NPDC049040]|uniref:CU044_2847 family protein n=1 Tax=Streptomyces sp. NPDC049040 TaxID=3365593 RepID=UPI00371F2B37